MSSRLHLLFYFSFLVNSVQWDTVGVLWRIFRFNKSARRRGFHHISGVFFHFCHKESSPGRRYYFPKTHMIYAFFFFSLGFVRLIYSGESVYQASDGWKASGVWFSPKQKNLSLRRLLRFSSSWSSPPPFAPFSSGEAKANHLNPLVSHQLTSYPLMLHSKISTLDLLWACWCPMSKMILKTEACYGPGIVQAESSSTALLRQSDIWVIQCASQTLITFFPALFH